MVELSGRNIFCLQYTNLSLHEANIDNMYGYLYKYLRADPYWPNRLADKNLPHQTERTRSAARRLCMYVSNEHQSLLGWVIPVDSRDK